MSSLAEVGRTGSRQAGSQHGDHEVCFLRAFWEKTQEQLRNAGVIPPLEGMTGRSERVTTVGQADSKCSSRIGTCYQGNRAPVTLCLEDCTATANGRATARQRKGGEARAAAARVCLCVAHGGEQKKSNGRRQNTGINFPREVLVS